MFTHIVKLETETVEALCLSFIVQYLPNPLSVQLWPKKKEKESALNSRTAAGDLMSVYYHYRVILLR